MAWGQRSFSFSLVGEQICNSTWDCRLCMIWTLLLWSTTATFTCQAKVKCFLVSLLFNLLLKRIKIQGIKVIYNRWWRKHFLTYILRFLIVYIYIYMFIKVQWVLDSTTGSLYVYDLFFFYFIIIEKTNSFILFKIKTIY